MREATLQEVFADLVSSDAPATGMSVTRAVADGRRRIRRRRLITAALGTVAVVTLAAGALGLPIQRPQVSSLTRTILVYDGSTIRRADGTMVTQLTVDPPASSVASVFRVPGGWVYLVVTGAGQLSVAWYQGNDGTARQIAADVQGVDVTSDGRTAVVTTSRGDMVAYDLPSLRMTARANYPGVQSTDTPQLPMVYAIRGTDVVVGDVQTAGPVVVWDIATDQTRTIPLTSGYPIGITSTGEVLFVDQECIRRANPTTAVVTDEACFFNPVTVDGAGAGSVSPDGTRAVFAIGSHLSVWRVGERTGAGPTLRPLEATPSTVVYWANASTFVATTDRAGQAYRCDLDTMSCILFDLPARTTDSGVVATVAGG